jgi:molybdate transport system substrate-binding protein
VDLIVPKVSFLPASKLVMLVLLLWPAAASCEPLRIAVASNFTATMRALVVEYQARSGDEVQIISGSTGKHFAQIRHGAPFDVFFAADRERPQRLEQDGFAVPGTRFSYAYGKLILWSPREQFVDASGQVLRDGEFQRLAIANPDLAPYGRAALDVLNALRLSATLKARLVRGENIAQAYQFVKTGNAELGFVALSQLLRNGAEIEGSYWRVPPDLYRVIDQQAIQISSATAAGTFLEFVQSANAAAIIQAQGYGIPERMTAR